MKTFLRNLSERREIKKKLVDGWSLKVSKKELLDYQVREFGLYCGYFITGLILMGSLIVAARIVGGAFKEITSLDGYQRGAAVMAFFCLYVFYPGIIFLAEVKGKKAGGNNLKMAHLKVFPSWLGEMAVKDQVDNFIKGRNRFLITGFLLSFICPLLAFSGWNDIQGFLGVFLASFFSYISLIALIVVGYYISLKVKYFSILAYIAMVFIFLVCVLSMASPDLLIIVDFCFHAFPPYWFFMGEGLYSFGLMEWCIHSIIFTGAALLWKPLWARLIQGLSEAEVDEDLELIAELTRDEARKRLLAHDSTNPFFSKFLWKRVLWFVALLGLACICFQQCLYREDMIGLLWRLAAYGLTMFSFSQLVILAFEGFAQGMGKTLKISQSRDAFEIGLFPLSAGELLRSSITRGICRTLPIGILGGLGFVMINLYGEAVPFQTMSLWGSFFIGILLFSAFEILGTLIEALLTYMPRKENTVTGFFLNLFFIMVPILGVFVLFFLGVSPFFENPEDGNQFSTWVVLWACYGVGAAIATSWIIYTHRKKVITLTYLRASRSS